MESRTFTVRNDADYGKGSLRLAVALANENPGTDTILLESDVKLDSPIQITDSLYIGTPYGATIEQTGEGRIFEIDDNDDFKFIDVSLQRLNLIGGNDISGAGVYSAENLTINDTTFTNNAATGNGGGLYQKDGLLSISRTKFEGNTSEATGNNEGNIFGGGAIYLENVEDFSIAQSVFLDNMAAKGSSISAENSMGNIFNTSFEDTGNMAAASHMYYDNSSVNVHFDFG